MWRDLYISWYAMNVASIYAKSEMCDVEVWKLARQLIARDSFAPLATMFTLASALRVASYLERSSRLQPCFLISLFFFVKAGLNRIVTSASNRGGQVHLDGSKPLRLAVSTRLTLCISIWKTFADHLHDDAHCPLRTILGGFWTTQFGNASHLLRPINRTRSNDRKRRPTTSVTVGL